MRVTDKTKYRQFQPAEPFLTPEAVAELKQAAEQKFGGMYDLTFAKFHAAVNGDYSEVLGDTADPTVLQVYWAKRLEDFAGEFVKALNDLTVKQTTDEQRASGGLLKLGWDEGLLIFMQQFFGLQSFKAAEQITLGEILIAKRAQYNRDQFQRNMANIQQQKFKQRKK